MRLFLFPVMGVLFFLFNGCAAIEKQEHSSIEPLSLKRDDFLEHLNWFGNGYLKVSDHVVLGKRETDYLNKVIANIKLSNPRVFKSDMPIKVVVIKDTDPIHFSLPNGTIVLTKALFQSMIDSENALATVLSIELIRVNFRTYQKQRVVPLGVFLKSDLKKFFKVSLSERVELDKWSYYCLQNAGFSPTSMLSWIQKQNKLKGSFWSREDSKNLSFEESQFKSFLINEVKQDSTTSLEVGQPSTDFYKLLNVLRHKQ